jgi:predicted regulator of Ras-like GTPase activity (Roadblock/LC7/MglB family)
MFKLLKRFFSPRRAGRPAVPTAVAVPAAPSSKISRIGDAAPGVEVASLSLRSILEKLPPDLKATINNLPEGNVKVVLPVNAIMKQLATGSVKMSLGSLHRQAPGGTFRKTNVEEKRMVDVPLAEVFKSINPGRLQRRHDQRHYVVPDEITGLFGENGTNRSVSSVSAAKSEIVAPAPQSPRTGPLQMPNTQPESRTGIPPGNGYPKPKPEPAPAAPAAPSTKVPAKAEAEPVEQLRLDGELSLSLVEIAANWPEGIRSELSVLTGDTKLVLPVSEVSTGLQKGKVQFTWQQIRGWLQPALTSQVNIADDTAIVLPLKIVAPAFVAATGAKKRKSAKAAMSQEMADFFGPTAGRAPGAPAPTPAPVAPPPKPAPVAPVQEVAPAPVAEVAPAAEVEAAPEPEAVPVSVIAASAPVHAAPVAEPQNLGELFNQPDKTDWTPNEMVKFTCGLPGVVGAVIALEEGLVVAQKLPPGLAAETFAAFMPQIFSRLDKYTGEMQLGETSEVSIQTTGGPCRFIRNGKVFFATLGKAGESLPAGLKHVADELVRQNS